MEKDYLSIIEGLLYLLGDDGLDVKTLSGVLEISKKETVELLDKFNQMYSQKETNGLELVNFGGIYKLATNPKYTNYYKKMVDQSKASLSNAALETLAIIAYNQPITRVEIEAIRGVGADAMIRKLIAKALIKEVGRQDSPGLPILYSVTDEFMDAFGLTNLAELPDLKDIVQIENDQNIFDTRYKDISDEDLEAF